MKRLSIRQWMLFGLFIFIASAAVFYHLAGLLDNRLLQPSGEAVRQRQAAIDALLNDAGADPTVWSDAAWQGAMRTRISTLGVGIEITDDSGAVQFQAGRLDRSRRPSRDVRVVQTGRTLGTVDLFVPPPVDPLAPVAAICALVLAVLFVRWQMGKYLVRPLEAVGSAARRIAKGNLEFVLPESRVREVAEVQAAFEAMRDGLRDSLQRQAELEEERRFFVGAIAHDLRSPLFVLRGSLVALQQGLAASPEKAARYATLAGQKADQLERLVEDLFSYTKAEYLDQTLRRERLQLGSLLQKTVDACREEARGRGITLKIEGSQDGCTIDGDGALIERAVQNLLENALRHTPSGGAVVISFRPEGARAVFTVADTGPGIPPREREHVFEPLYRGESSRNRDTGGIGLGLTIARRILRAHGGDLVVVEGQRIGAAFIGWIAISSPAEPETRLFARDPDASLLAGSVRESMQSKGGPP